MSAARTVPFTKASLRRAADVAREKGFAVIIRPDGTLVLEQRNYPQQSEQQPVEDRREILL
jgi:prophage tail gpP-like protein